MHFICKFKENHPQTFLRFCLTGILNTFIDFLVFIFLYYKLGVALLVAHCLSFLAATVNSYFVNKFWTFNERHKKADLAQFAKFLLITGSGLCLSSVILYISTYFVPAYAGKIAAIFFTVFWNYTGSRLFVFNNKIKN
jgi:putative flippase GtrA